MTVPDDQQPKFFSHTWYSQRDQPLEAFTDDECAELIRLAEEKGVRDVRGLRDPDTRELLEPEGLSVDSYKLSWDDVPEAKPLMQKMANVVWQANSFLWEFELTLLPWIEMLHYRTGHQYLSHVDWLPEIPQHRVLHRKLSLAINLSDADNYEGGDLVLDCVGQRRVTDRAKGTITVFPAMIPHWVTEVTSGERWSCIGWVQGPPFK